MAGTDGAATDLLLRTGRWFTRGEVSPDLRTVTKAGGRAGDVFYRDRWSHDKVVRSTHGVNCTGSCRWKVYVKDGIITWETQETDYRSSSASRSESWAQTWSTGASRTVVDALVARVRAASGDTDRVRGPGMRGRVSLRPPVPCPA